MRTRYCVHCMNALPEDGVSVPGGGDAGAATALDGQGGRIGEITAGQQFGKQVATAVDGRAGRTPEPLCVCPTCGMLQETEEYPHHLKPGTVLHGKYLIGVALGEGGFGITYIGRDMTLDMRIAVKEYYPSGLTNRNSTASSEVTVTARDRRELFEKGKGRFLDEARALAIFSGEPGIVNVRDFFEENNSAYIVMEYLDGITLKDYLQRHGPFAPDGLIALLRPLMETLAKVHARGLIHRDISPDNIMMISGGTPAGTGMSASRTGGAPTGIGMTGCGTGGTPAGTGMTGAKYVLKLLDFGAARDVTGGNEKSLSVMLKPGYAPEEQYRSKGAQGPWTDIYALCATIYKCITGITPEEATQRIVYDDLKSPSQLGAAVSPALENAIMKGLSVRAEGRFQRVEELLVALDAGAAQGNGGGALRAAGGNRTRGAAQGNGGGGGKAGPKKRKPGAGVIAAVIAAAIGAVCIIAVAGVVLWRGVFSDGSILGTGIAPGGRSETEEVAQESSKSKSSGATIAEGRSETEDAIQESSGSKSSQATIAGERYKPDKTSLNLYGVALTDEDLVQMQQLKSVTSLSIRDCTLENAGAGEVFWDYVTGLIQLHYLQLSGSPDLLSYAVGAGRAPELAGCANLESLYLNDCGLTDISFLDGMGALWWLELDGNQVADIGPLAGLTKLTHLSLEGNQIEDITPLAGLTKLTHLSLAGNQIEDIAPLAGLTGITHLSLAGNRVEDVGPLSGMTKVQELYLNGNKIADVSGMTNCAVLTHVNLADNRISDIDFLKKSMGSLLEADVSRNQIGDETFRTAFGDMEALRTLLADGNLLQFADTAFDFTLSLGGMADATSDDPRAISLMRFLESVPEIAEYDEGANRVTGRLHGLDLAAFHLPALRTLSLADNELAGFDFAGINSSQMPLQSLNLSGNRLEAALDIPFTTVLTTLDLSHNGIQWVSGVLESGEGGQVAAYAGRGIELNLGYNALTAPFVMLPVSLSYTTLWLDHNALDAASYGALASLAATSPKRLHIDFLADPNNPNGDMDLTGVAASPFSYIYLYGTPRDQQEKVRAGLRGKIQEIVE